MSAMGKERRQVEKQLNEELDNPDYVPLFEWGHQEDMFERMKHRILFAKDEEKAKTGTRMEKMVMSQC